MPTWRPSWPSWKRGSGASVFQREGPARHEAATAFVAGLHERRERSARPATRPPSKPSAELQEQLQAPKRREAEKVRRQMVDAGYKDFQLPQEIEDFHLDIMRRDLAIQQGRIGDVIPELDRELPAWA